MAFSINQPPCRATVGNSWTLAVLIAVHDIARKYPGISLFANLAGIPKSIGLVLVGSLFNCYGVWHSPALRILAIFDYAHFGVAWGCLATFRDAEQSFATDRDSSHGVDSIRIWIAVLLGIPAALRLLPVSCGLFHKGFTCRATEGRLVSG